MTPCPHAPIPVRMRGAMRSDPLPPAMSSWCSSTASTATCSGATAARSSPRRISTRSPGSEPSASRRTSQARSHACRRATTSCAGRSTSSGDPGARSRSGRSPSPRSSGGAGVTTMLVSDHPHLFEVGGENYHTDFSAWDYARGHEGDPWRTYPDPSYIGAPALPARGGGWFWRDRLGWADAGDRPYDRSRTFFRAEEDFPGPRTMRTAAAWLRDGAPAAAPFLLFVDEFDPHEPFDTPEPWAGRYDPDWEGELLIWPPYDVGAVAQGRLSEREGRHIRANYGAKLSMIDHWAGEVFAALTERDLWDSTAVIVCTDHGHYLGEKDIWGKPGVMQYEPLGHTPLLVHWPGVPGGTECTALDDQRRHSRHRRRRVRRTATRGRPRRVTGPVVARRGGRGAGVGHRRRLRELGAGDGRPAQVRPRRRRRQLPALLVVQPVVHHARARLGGRGPPPPARPAGPSGLHAGVGRPGDPPTLRAGRPVAVLGGARRRGRPLPLRPRRGPGRGREPLRHRGRGGHGGPAARRPRRRCRPRGSSSSGWASRDGGGAALRPAADPRIGWSAALRRAGPAPHRQPHLQGPLDDSRRDHGGRRRDALGGLPARGERGGGAQRGARLLWSRSTSCGRSPPSRAGCASSSTAGSCPTRPCRPSSCRKRSSPSTASRSRGRRWGS